MGSTILWRLAISTLLFIYSTLVARAQFLATAADFDRWNISTDAQIAYQDPGFWDPLATKDHLRVIGCTERVGDKCGGLCLFYHAARKAECRMATGSHELSIACIAATHPITVCRGDCVDCDSRCATRLEDGFCSVPNSYSFIQTDVESDPALPSTSSNVVSSSTTSSSPPETQSPTTSSTSSFSAPDLPAESTSSKSTSTTSSPEFATLLGSSKRAHSPSDSAGAAISAEPSEQDEQSSTSAFPIGAIIGIIVGVLLVGAMAIFLAICMRRRRASREILKSYSFSGTITPAHYRSVSFSSRGNRSAAPSSSFYAGSSGVSTPGFTSVVEIDCNDHGIQRGPLIERPPPYANG